MNNVIRNYFLTRFSCPTPEWDQAVYKYDTKSDSLDFLWVVPAKDICKNLKDNALNIDPSEKELLNFVLSFEDGTLLQLSKKLNNEQIQ